MFISFTASTANGFQKWSAAHPAAKYAPKSDEAVATGPAVSDPGSTHAESVEASADNSNMTRPATGGDCRSRRL